MNQSERCRICLDSIEMDKMISPCNCRGSMGKVHKQCLEMWLNTTKKIQCEICGYNFEITRNFPSCSQWLNRGQSDSIDSSINNTTPANRNASTREQPIISDVLCLLLLIFVFSVCIWLTYSSTIVVSGRPMHPSGRQTFNKSEHSGDRAQHQRQRSMFWNRKINAEAVTLTVLFSCLMLVCLFWIWVIIRHKYYVWRRWRLLHSNQVIHSSRRIDAATPLITTNAQNHNTVVNPDYQSISQGNHNSARVSQSILHNNIDSQELNHSINSNEDIMLFDSNFSRIETNFSQSLNCSSKPILSEKLVQSI